MANVEVVTAKNQFFVRGSKDVEGRETYEVSHKTHEFIIVDTGDVFEFYHAAHWGDKSWKVFHRDVVDTSLRVTIKTSNKGECLLRVSGEFNKVKLKVKEDKK